MPQDTHVILERFCYCEQGTFGRLYLPELSVLTVERPWLQNQPFLSCIPEGDYQLRPSRFYRGGYDTWEVLEVPNRTRILVHRGNRAHDVQGCIAVGMTLGCVGGAWAVLDSRTAFAAFMRAMGDGEAARLTLRSVAPAAVL